MSDKPSYAVGLSGGVDSSVAAALLVSRGHRVVGLTMKKWDGSLDLPDGGQHTCFGPGEAESVASCGRLCEKLGIPYYAIDLTDDFRTFVLDYFRAEYLRGRTPNPCVACNHAMKFGMLIARAREQGAEFDRFATGHYARIDRSLPYPRLRAGSDASRDQSYFLYRIPRETLDIVDFPLGDITKDETRSIARSLGLEMADKSDSQDFVAGGDYATLFGGAGETPGDIVDGTGKVLGRHRGIVHYTIGQRRGIGVSAGPEAVYVTAIDAARNRVIVSGDASLFASGLEAGDLVLADGGLASSFEAFVRVRQNHVPARADVSIAGGVARVRFETPQRAMAPGQSAVFYDADGFVLGGGIIERAVRE